MTDSCHHKEARGGDFLEIIWKLSNLALTINRVNKNYGKSFLFFDCVVDWKPGIVHY